MPGKVEFKVIHSDRVASMGPGGNWGVLYKKEAGFELSLETHRILREEGEEG